jgi:hypothetical protein
MFGIFNLNNLPNVLSRDNQYTSPWERSELPFRAVLGEVKYKISVFGPKVKTKRAKPARITLPGWDLYGSASRIVCFKKFFIGK